MTTPAMGGECRNGGEGQENQNDEETTAHEISNVPG